MVSTQKFRGINAQKVGLAVGLLFVVFAVSSPASAAVDNTSSSDRESITLSPASKKYKLKPGTVKNDVLTVINDGTSKYTFITYARPYSVNDESYAPDFTNDANNADAYKWVQFDNASYEIQPGEMIEIGYTIRVPKDATPGGHYGVMFAETQTQGTVEGTGVERKKRVGSILYMTVDGDVKLKGSLRSTDVPLFQTSPPLKISQRVENTGNTDFSVTSSVQVSGLFGGVKHKAESSYSVLPGTTRNFSLDWQNPAWMGVYKVEVNTALLDSKEKSTHYVLLIPAWVYIVFAVLIGARVAYGYALSRRKR